MKRSVLVFLALLVVAAVPALSANDPCFDISCNSGSCTFDPSCSTATPFIWKVKWDFGDGTGTALTGPSSQTHTYSIQNCFADVTLTVYPWSNEIESITCQVIHTTCLFGPAGEHRQPTVGRCTAAGLS